MLLPLPEVRTSEDSVLRPQRTITGFKGRVRRILVADDKSENRSVLERLLSPLGFDLVEAEDGREALEKATQSPPDLVFMDLVMPVMDGFEATRRLRRSPGLEHVPVIGLSASVFERTQRKSKLAGCDDFIPKPLRTDVIFEKLETHLGLEWVYAEPDEAEVQIADSSDAQGSPSASLAALPAEDIKALYELAEVGDIDAIVERLDKLRASNAACRAPIAQLRALAKQYKMSDVCAALRPHLPVSENR